MRHTDRDTDRQASGDTETQIDVDTHTWTDRKIDIYMERQYTDRQRNRQKDTWGDDVCYGTLISSFSNF